MFGFVRESGRRGAPALLPESADLRFQPGCTADNLYNLIKYGARRGYLFEFRAAHFSSTGLSLRSRVHAQILLTSGNSVNPVCPMTAQLDWQVIKRSRYNAAS